MSSIYSTSSTDSFWSLTTSSSDSTVFYSASSCLTLDSYFDEDEPLSLEEQLSTFIITLAKENGSFGMCLKLAFDALHRFEGFKVTKLQHQSPAFRALYEGDVILGVNDILFRKYNVHNALDILAAEGRNDEIILRIRFVDQSWQEEKPQMDSESPTTLDARITEVEHHTSNTLQPPKGSFGRRFLRALKRFCCCCCN